MKCEGRHYDDWEFLKIWTELVFLESVGTKFVIDSILFINILTKERECVLG